MLFRWRSPKLEQSEEETEMILNEQAGPQEESSIIFNKSFWDFMVKMVELYLHRLLLHFLTSDQVNLEFLKGLNWYAFWTSTAKQNSKSVGFLGPPKNVQDTLKPSPWIVRFHKSDGFPGFRIWWLPAIRGLKAFPPLWVAILEGHFAVMLQVDVKVGLGYFVICI